MMAGGIEAIFAAAVDRLAAAGVEAPRREARLLLAHAAGRAGEVLFPRDVELDAAGRSSFAAMVARRAGREPLSRIVGSREFWSLPFRLGPAALGPRADTETLVEAVLARVGDRSAPLRILDLGTGSGCIALALLSELPAATAIGVDRSAPAAAIARDNAARLGLADRFSAVVGDWDGALSATFDIVVSNPPNIPSGEIDGLAPEVAGHDPPAALDGGPDGLSAYRRIVLRLAHLLAPGGLAGLEIGAAQAGLVRPLLAMAGFDPVETVPDIAGRDRCLLVRRKSPENRANPVKKSLAPPPMSV